MSDDEFDPQPGPAGRSGPSLFLIGLVAVAVITAVFIAQNRERTEIQLLVFDVQSRVWTAIAISIALGVVLDRLVLGWWRRARRRKQQS